MTNEELDDMDQAARDLVLEAVKEAEAAPYPEPEELMQNYYCD